ncbi:MAG: hypothetical protein TYPL_4230 [Candidatus Tyloplasma litorale]|nr:MAG: hypothetical protein TYPL_4230 [Mycoplasmatales bacterium]
MKMNINDVIKRPIITEKSSSLLMKNVYTLEIDSRATKTDVKAAVELIFEKSGAKVSKVNMLKVKPRPKRMGKYEGYTKGYKKAIVTLSTGSIPVYGADGAVVNNEEQKRAMKIIDTDKILAQAEKEN